MFLYHVLSTLKIYIRLLVSEKNYQSCFEEIKRKLEVKPLRTKDNVHICAKFLLPKLNGDKVCSKDSVQILSIDPLIITFYRLEAKLLHTSLLFIDYTLSISIKVNI